MGVTKVTLYAPVPAFTAEAIFAPPASKPPAAAMLPNVFIGFGAEFIGMAYPSTTTIAALLAMLPMA